MGGRTRSHLTNNKCLKDITPRGMFGAFVDVFVFIVITLNNFVKEFPLYRGRRLHHAR